jgi:beta-fructofuranosidase
VRRAAGNFGLTLSGPAQNSTSWLNIQYDSQRPTEILIDARPIPLGVSEKENFKLELYIDGSVIEAFVNNKVAYTKRFYYSGDAPQDMRLKWTGKASNLVSLSVFQLTPISPDRLTS